MKLYSRNQVIFYSIGTALLVFLLLFGFGLISLSSFNSDIPALTNSSFPEVEIFPSQPATSLGNPVFNSSDYSEDELTNIGIYERYNEAVVNVTTEVVGYNWFLEPIPQEGSSGSGSIIDKRGFVLTNNHVVDKAYKVYITLADGSQYEGEVVGTDYENDLSVLKFDPEDKELVTIPFGTSDHLKVGQKVIAIGNPFAFERTLTTGIVSGLGRPLKNDSGLVIRDMIQTDASINPGNSGGPLINMKGEMIGINTMIYTPSGGSVGIGFAIPVDTARRVVPDLIKFGKVQRGWIDIVPVQLFPSLVRYGKLPLSKGILISRVINGGNAEDAGLLGGDPDQAVRSGNSVIYLGGDIITGINGVVIATLSDFYGALEATRPGDEVEVEVLRRKQTKILRIKLSERPTN
ncbi:trypsin-like peptidase domain-containing protein [Oceanispirochaeta sp.]|jgi:S1-C subfamily serine protease|uniref:S1C family serine protease n=1 Tax=Oceanispirochaeta sp. TaxID=2035350 RepID=UPI00262C36B8|nr:trypsin-like peptidase domain-containing protein [Oceanispirochaeta sp.]MDA3955566.1 trypsin-like peptidase domain-containing protein [Oceanispirochaeta sp.]